MLEGIYGRTKLLKIQIILNIAKYDFAMNVYQLESIKIELRCRNQINILNVYS